MHKIVESRPAVLSLMLTEIPKVEADRGLIAVSALMGDTPVKCHMHRHDAALLARKILKAFDSMQEEQAEVLEIAAAKD